MLFKTQLAALLGAALIALACSPVDMSKPWTPYEPETGFMALFPRSHGHALPPYTPTLEELFAKSSDVARVRLLAVGERVVDLSTTEGIIASNGYTIQMAFKFEALEWIKGGGVDGPIWGMVGLEDVVGKTVEEARWKAAYYYETRDASRDDKEAVVFLQDLSGTLPPNHYSIGWLGPDDYNAPWMHWLPVASSGAASGASGGQRFLWDDYAIPFPGQSGASGASDDKTVSLVKLKRLAGLSETELDKRNRSARGVMVVNSSQPPETGLSYFGARSKTTPQGNWIGLSWPGDPVGSGVTGYRILRRAQADSSFIQLADVLADGVNTHYDDTQGIKPETKYIYRLRAYNADGDIADARVAITTVAELEPLDAPAAPTATPPAVSADATPTPTATATATPAPAAAPSDGGAPDAPTPTATATPTATPEPPPPGGVSGQ